MPKTRPRAADVDPLLVLPLPSCTVESCSHDFWFLTQARQGKLSYRQNATQQCPDRCYLLVRDTCRRSAQARNPKPSTPRELCTGRLFLVALPSYKCFFFTLKQPCASPLRPASVLICAKAGVRFGDTSLNHSVWGMYVTQRARLPMSCTNCTQRLLFQFLRHPTVEHCILLLDVFLENVPVTSIAKHAPKRPPTRGQQLAPRNSRINPQQPLGWPDPLPILVCTARDVGSQAGVQVL